MLNILEWFVNYACDRFTLIEKLWTHEMKDFKNVKKL